MSETDPGQAEPRESDDNEERKPRGERTKRFLKVTAKAAGEELGGYYGDRVAAAGESWDHRREESDEEKRKWHEDQESRRAAKAQAVEDKARAAVEAAAAAREAADAEAVATPEQSTAQERADEYMQQLDREKLFADTRRGIGTVNVEDPDDDLRQALYDKLNVKEAEHWTRESDATKSGSEVWGGWKHPLKIPKMPWRAAKYIKERSTGLVPLDADGSHFEVRRYLVSEDNETAIEEVFHQRMAGVEGKGKAGDMSLASTRLIYVKGGAYEEKGRKLVATKALRGFQQLPRMQTKSLYKDLAPVTDVNLPAEGPEPGSLPDNGEFSLHGAGEHEAAGHEAEAPEVEWVLPPAPDLGPGAVEPTPQPQEPYRRKPKPEAEVEPEVAPAPEAVVEAESEDEAETARPIENVSAQVLNDPPDSEMEPEPGLEPDPDTEPDSEPEPEPAGEPDTTMTGRKARRARVQDPKHHPQMMDPNRPLEKRPYDGIARSSRLNEPGSEGLNTRRAGSPEGPAEVRATEPETISQPAALETETAPEPVPARVEYSVETGRRLEEDGYSGFSELVHRIQDEDERFGVPLSGELTHAQVGVLLDRAQSSDEVETLEQELVKRDTQYRKDTKSNRPALLGDNGKMVGRNEDERILIREIEKKYEKFRQAELDAEREHEEPEAQPTEAPVETGPQISESSGEDLSERLDALGDIEDLGERIVAFNAIGFEAANRGLAEVSTSSMAGVKELSNPGSPELAERSREFVEKMEAQAAFAYGTADKPVEPEVTERRGGASRENIRASRKNRQSERDRASRPDKESE